MARYRVQQAGLLGCAVTLGEIRREIDDEPEYYANDPVRLGRLKEIIGLGTRWIAAPGTTAADLCADAAKRLLLALEVQPADIDLLVSVTQTPDYRMPGNAHVLHARLKLPAETAALDLGLGCSGFVYGLWLAALAAAGGRRKVLLLAGDTLSKCAGARDKTAAPLFGDAGSASLIDFSPGAPDMNFILKADGSGLESMYIPAGGARRPASPETLRQELTEDGGARSAENVRMNGFEIFNFAMTRQPELLREILEFSGKTVNDVDFFVLHQANRYIVQTITRKAGIPGSKAPADIFTRYGNQNSASIPGVLCGALPDKLKGRKVQAVLQGYGTGLSWAACQLELADALCLPPVVLSPPEN